MKARVAVDVIVFLFILLFMYAALTKLMDYEKFKVQLGQSPFLTRWAGWVAWGIPALEILLSVMLVVPKFQLVGLYSAFTLMVIFTGYIFIILNSNEHIPCSCGGVLEKLGWEEHLVFNSGFILFGLTGILLYPADASVKPQASESHARRGLF